MLIVKGEIMNRISIGIFAVPGFPIASIVCAILFFGLDVAFAQESKTVAEPTLDERMSRVKWELQRNTESHQNIYEKLSEIQERDIDQVWGSAEDDVVNKLQFQRFRLKVELAALEAKLKAIQSSNFTSEKNQAKRTLEAEKEKIERDFLEKQIESLERILITKQKLRSKALVSRKDLENDRANLEDAKLKLAKLQLTNKMPGVEELFLQTKLQLVEKKSQLRMNKEHLNKLAPQGDKVNDPKDLKKALEDTRHQIESLQKELREMRKLQAEKMNASDG